MLDTFKLTVVERPAAENDGRGKTSEYFDVWLEWIDGYLNGNFGHFAMLGIGSDHSIESLDDMEGYFRGIKGGTILVFEGPWNGGPPDPKKIVATITDFSTP